MAGTVLYAEKLYDNDKVDARCLVRRARGVAHVTNLSQLGGARLR